MLLFAIILECYYYLCMLLRWFMLQVEIHKGLQGSICYTSVACRNMTGNLLFGFLFQFCDKNGFTLSWYPKISISNCKAYGTHVLVLSTHQRLPCLVTPSAHTSWSWTPTSASRAWPLPRHTRSGPEHPPAPPVPGHCLGTHVLVLSTL